MDALEGSHAIVHLAGENIAGKRWTESFKQTILTSRTQSTELISRSLAQLNRPPEVLSLHLRLASMATGLMNRLLKTPRWDLIFWLMFAMNGKLQRVLHPMPVFVLSILRIGVVLSKQGGALKKCCYRSN